jgi:hypothetical protein
MPGVSVTGILGYINTVSKIMYGKSTDAVIWKLSSGTDQFPYPRLADVSDISSYIEISPANLVTSDGDAITAFEYNGIEVQARKVAYLFCERKYLNSDACGIGTSVVPDKGVAGKDWVKYPISTIDYGNGPAKVKLLSLPTDGVKMYVNFYIQVPDITTISDSTLLDFATDFEIIKNGVVGYYEDVINGRSEKLQLFNNGLMLWLNEKNQLGDNTYDRTFPDREIG